MSAHGLHSASELTKRLLDMKFEGAPDEGVNVLIEREDKRWVVRVVAIAMVALETSVDVFATGKGTTLDQALRACQVDALGPNKCRLLPTGKISWRKDRPAPLPKKSA